MAQEFAKEFAITTTFQISQKDLRRLIKAADDYDRQYPHYDDVFIDTGKRLRSQGHATKEDVAILAFWKGINLSTPWPRRLLELDPNEVRVATEKAFSGSQNDEDRLSTLSRLPGFFYWKGPNGGAIPSTLLCCWDPENYAITDVRAREALGALGAQTKGVLEYFEAVRDIRDSAREQGTASTAREIEKGLFILAGNKKRRLTKLE